MLTEAWIKIRTQQASPCTKAPDSCLCKCAVRGNFKRWNTACQRALCLTPADSGELISQQQQAQQLSSNIKMEGSASDMEDDGEEYHVQQRVRVPWSEAVSPHKAWGSAWALLFPCQAEQHSARCAVPPEALVHSACQPARAELDQPSCCWRIRSQDPLQLCTQYVCQPHETVETLSG